MTNVKNGYNRFYKKNLKLKKNKKKKIKVYAFKRK